MSLPELVFKTTSSAAIAWWRDLNEAHARQTALRTNFEDEMTALYGPSQRDTYERDADGNKIPQTRRRLWVRGHHAYALDSGYGELPPTDSGWRLDSKDRNWQPKLATAAGKGWKIRLAELNILNLEERYEAIGIPPLAFAGSYLYRPGLKFNEETQTLYVTWGSQHVQKEWDAHVAKHPEVVWVQERLSAYIAWREEVGEDA